MEPAAKKPRRSWTREEATRLLQHYFCARNDASLRSDKGIKSKAWTLIISRLGEDGVDADKDQCRSKYSRLMSEYDAFKRLCNLSGAGWSSETNTTTLDEEGWAALAQAQPRNAALSKRFKTKGFFHDNICALLAGDSRATADDASSVRQFDAEVLLAASSSVDANDYLRLVIQQQPSMKQDQMSRNTYPRVQDAKASMAAFMKTAEAYFAMKMKMMARELGEGEDATV
ncbi:hypothetical protein PF006_g6287 [Phytophthora fragariae]|uniref:Myb/SANT-like domain-containing protein n=1 Tax=Phytophthora fragariae TaxID=53985 RepID=A0A6A3LF43_9STRA|nr:hypothetical protein PF011_g7104 [Phytophthora fragariae]KAE9149208.1 hypothetical protein PF006_g6287 [Phytophthora fragariae]